MVFFLAGALLESMAISFPIYNDEITAGGNSNHFSSGLGQFLTKRLEHVTNIK